MIFVGCQVNLLHHIALLPFTIDTQGLDYTHVKEHQVHHAHVKEHQVHHAHVKEHQVYDAHVKEHQKKIKTPTALIKQNAPNRNENL